MWRCRFVILFALLALCTYFVVGSGWFFKRFVLERISSASACRITVEQAGWNPIAGAQLRGVKVTAINGDPIASFDKMDLTFANPLIQGGWIVTEFEMDRPAITVKRVGGVSNVDSIRTAINKLLRQKKKGGALPRVGRGWRGTGLPPFRKYSEDLPILPPRASGDESLLHPMWSTASC